MEQTEWGYLLDRDKREVPCTDCQHEDECAVKLLECVAMRNWYYGGDYKDKDIGRLRRIMKFK